MVEDSSEDTGNRCTDTQKKISRRKLLAAIPATTAFASPALASSAGGNSSTEIVILENGGGSPGKTVKVPKKWHQHIQNVEKEIEQLKDRYSDKSWVEGVGAGPLRSKVAGKPAPALQVKTNEKAEKKMDKRGGSGISLPDSNGIPVKTKRTEKAVPQGFKGSCVPDANGNDVSGGEICDSEGGSRGTTGYFVNREGRRYMLTAHHIFQGNCQKNLDGSASQGSTYMGEIFQNGIRDDWATISDTSSALDFSKDPWIVTGDGHSGDLVNYVVNQDGLYHYQSSGKTAFRFGISTGGKYGQITSAHTTNSYDCYTQQDAVEYNIDGAGGDSGGPVYSYINDGVALIGHHLYGWNNLGSACNGAQITANGGCFAAHKLADYTKYSVDTHSF